MNERIVNPNKESRSMFIGIAVLACGYCLIVSFMRPDMAWALLGCILVFAALVLSLSNAPYVILTSEGVSVRFLLEKPVLYCWNQLVQAGIIKTNVKRGGKEYVFAIVLLLPGASPVGTEKKNAILAPNWNRQVVLPNTKEIREYVLTHYGPLDFNDIEKLNDWEKKYYHFD